MAPASVKQSRHGYTVISQIGEGAFARLYLVSSKTSLYVLKEHKTTSKTLADAQHMLTEVQILRRSSRHPCIIGFHEAFISPSGGVLSIVCEYASGGDLQALLKRYRAFPGTKPGDDIVCSWIAQIGLGLHALHRMFNVMHRDIKPANILVLGDGRVVLGDFGSSKVLETDLAVSFVGTPFFMSPEILRGESYDFSSDVWALAVLGFEAVTLEKPFLIGDGGVGRRAPITLGELRRRIELGQGAWHLLRGSRLEPLLLAMSAQKKELRPPINEVLLFPAVSAGLGGFIRDLAAGKFSISAPKADMLVNQISAIGLRGLALQSLRLGRAQRRKR